MKKLLLLPTVLLTLVACSEQNEVHLLCTTGIAENPSTDSGVKESYDVRVKFLDDGAMLMVDGQEYELKQEYDVQVSFYRTEPWYNLQIGNRNHATKYSLGIPTNEDFARYTSCEEID